MVEKFNVGLIVVDSIAANFRAEFERPMNKRLKTSGESASVQSGPAQMARRGKELVGLAETLRRLAGKHNLAVVVANQVSDKFTAGVGERGDAMGLDFQGRWFSGWDDRVDGDAKAPALGLVWANLLAGRVVLRRSGEGGGDWRRSVKVVFATWAQAGVERRFEIVEGGVKVMDDEG